MIISPRKKKPENILTATKSMNISTTTPRRLIVSAAFGAAILMFGFFAAASNLTVPPVAAEESNDAIETATYTRQEFFGAQAIMPLPSAEARENLAKLAANAPDDPRILEKLAELDEKTEHYDEAEKNLQHLAETDAAKLENLAQFYERRARFESEAATIEKIMANAAVENRAATFERLIYLAQKHDLQEYLNADFYARVLRENAGVYPIFKRLIDNFAADQNYAQALELIHQAKMRFPEKRNVLLSKEIEILLDENQPQTAEKVYQAAFDPFWTETEAQKFYDFLNSQNRLRAYGAEIRTRFRANPADFDAGVRLALYQNHDYSYGNDDVAPIIRRLEAGKKSWTTDELVTVSRLLLQANEADAAARFLYTLYLSENFKKNSAQRAKILYQLFEMFSDAETMRLPLTKGDLRFYEDVAHADTKPGMATGILSLIFSDSDVREKFAEQETEANKHFNRAAAYRIYEEYKAENPQSNELAQMSLDLIRLYTATEETEIAEKILDEFAGKYQSSEDFPAAALKLADAFIAVKNEAKAREVYQKTLDYLGKQNQPLHATNLENDAAADETGEANVSAPIDAADRSDGINIPNADQKSSANDYYYAPPTVFHDYLDRRNARVTYEEVLEKLVASFVKEKKTAEILRLYSDEIDKYPNEEWLYEQRLSRLEQTNLTAEELAVYKAALARFPTNEWRDKLARFFVRNERDAEFAEFSEDLIAKLNDADAQKYLAEFIDNKYAATMFEKRLTLKLYQSAHARFPHDLAFVNGLLRIYKGEKQDQEWRELAAEYYFESAEVRESLLDNLAKNDLLRDYLARANNSETTIYSLFRADAAVRLSDYENAVAAYRKLDELYPHTPELANRLINLTRSFGQGNREFLKESAQVAVAQADYAANSAERRTRAGEIFAELGDYQNAREQWEKLIPTAAGDKEIYLDAATVYWDYFQYADARREIKNLRVRFADDTLYAFETGAILEAENDQKAAVGEYVKALDADRDDAQQEKAIRRLTTLAARDTRAHSDDKTPRTNIENVIAQTFSREAERRTNADYLSLGYAQFLAENRQPDRAAEVLNRAVRRSADGEFLDAAQSFYQREENAAGEQFVLARLAATAKNPRQAISYQLRLADSYADGEQPDAAKNVLAKLVRKFPTNYGVLIETSDFYQRIGDENQSARVLETALPHSVGAYRVALAAKLSNRLINLNRLAEAEQILANLNEADQSNVEIFDELAGVYVRTNAPEKLRKTFAETVAALSKTDAEPREIAAQIADLRTAMIDAFTKLKDYQSAVEQHIEIINREPENERLTDDAIAFVQRYGAAETLVNYYEKLAAEAFKNYRWNVVLARIYEAKKDDANALKNYQTAIASQPEMPELYLAVVEIETRRGDYEAAIANINEVLKISGDAAIYVKKKIEILKKAGRIAEIAAEKAKLPAAENVEKPADEFAAARILPVADKEKARAIYRAAFDKIIENPLTDHLWAADIAGYVAALRETDSLAALNENLWTLRGKLTTIADTINSVDAGEAEARRKTLDGAFVESIGATAQTRGTDEELQNLHDDWRGKIDAVSFKTENHQTVSLLQNLSRRAGFGDLEELILIKKIENDEISSNREISLHNLIDFYNQRGAYQKTLDALEKFGGGSDLKAEAARIVGDQAKELEYRRAIYWEKGLDYQTAPNENVARYLEILNRENPDELQSLTAKSSIYQLQLINFLLSKGKANLAHAAIANADLPTAWKVSRHAETSLALREFDESSECYFCDALQLDSIGEMVGQSPDKQRFLINDDWFRLSREYGEWLFEKKDKVVAPSQFTTAMTENQPRNRAEQTKLGEFYLAADALKPAVEHLRLAVQLENSAVTDKATLATLGAAYYKIGRKDYAADSWAQVLDDETIQSGAVFFQVLQANGLAAVGRTRIAPLIVKFLEMNNTGDDEDFQNLIRAVAASFGDDENAKADYFTAIVRQRPKDVSLAARLIDENLIAPSMQNSFYESLISRSENISDSDYDFASVADRVLTTEDAETVDEQAHEYKTEEPENDRYERQKKYVELLIGQKNNAEAARRIAEIERELAKRYARPAWLRATKIRLAIRAGKYDAAEAESFVGIRVSDAAATINPPSVERFNEIRNILQSENRTAEALNLSGKFFARMLALNQSDAANFAGLARTFFQENETGKAIGILHLLTRTADADERQTALNEVASLAEVKAQAADAAKISAVADDSANLPNALRIAAENADEFGQTDEAAAFRRQLLAADPTDSANKIELAQILDGKGETTEAQNLLTEIINDKDSLRTARWRARTLLNAAVPNVFFDTLSQFYNGNIAVKTSRNDAAAAFYINSLIADMNAQTSARQELIRVYALTGKPFAALRLAETDRTAKPDELLETLSVAAEKTGDFQKAMEYENGKSAVDEARISALRQSEKERVRTATDFKFDLENTRQL